MLKAINWNVVISVLILFALWAVNANLKELQELIHNRLNN